MIKLNNNIRLSGSLVGSKSFPECAVSWSESMSMLSSESLSESLSVSEPASFAGSMSVTGSGPEPTLNSLSGSITHDL